MRDDNRDGESGIVDARPGAESLTEGEALDRAISAAMDDELAADAFDALRERIASEPHVAERVRAFHAIDAGLRRLAEDELSETGGDDGHAIGLVDLEARLAPTRRIGWGRRIAPAVAAFAAAAALVLYLQSAGPEAPPGPDTPAISALDDVAAPTRNDDFDGTLDETLEEELSVALGYGEDVDILPDVRLEDFEVVDHLELLDLLSERDSEGRG